MMPGSAGAEDDLPRASHNRESTRVRVAVRVRPPSHDAGPDAVRVRTKKELGVHIPSAGSELRFHFDLCLTPDTTQAQTHALLGRPLLEAAFAGYDSCMFAYGQTGSGKTYSMTGVHGNDGVVPRLCQEVAAQIVESDEDVQVEVSHLEVYRERIRDLLAAPSPVKPRTPKTPSYKGTPLSKTPTAPRTPGLRIREHPELGPYVANLTRHKVADFVETQSLLATGERRRATAATGMNDKSSRSHSLFTIHLTMAHDEMIDSKWHKVVRKSRINLVDLAGSERVDRADMDPDRLEEGISTNKSLLTLGKVITCLAEQKSNSRRKVFIPYRDSVLTWLLKESLGGNSRTTMLATVSPCAAHVEETLSTLRYANLARSVVNRVCVNEDPNARLIRELRREIEELKLANHVPSNVSLLQTKEKEMEELQGRMESDAAEEPAAEGTRRPRRRISSYKRSSPPLYSSNFLEAIMACQLDQGEVGFRVSSALRIDS